MADTAPMKVVEVVPILRGLGRETLSYFTRGDFAPGSFVRIPVRNREVLGLVINTEDARNAKAALKVANFELKRLTKVEVENVLPENFIKAARMTAHYYATTLGSLLGALLPKSILESPDLLPPRERVPIGAPRETLIVQLPDLERLREYKGLVRERFARGQSVMVCVPTYEDALRIEGELSLGIQDYVFATSRKNAKNLRETLTRAYRAKHPILFITTPSFLFFDRDDLTTIIMERENSRSYQSLRRPYYHVKTFLENYAKTSKKTLILGDSILSFDSLYKKDNGEYLELTPLTWRTSSAALWRTVDMRRKNALHNYENQSEFKVFSKPLINLLNTAVHEHKKVFLFGVRKGLAPSTVCGHCGSVLLCQNCGSPVVLHKTNVDEKTGADRIYRCHHCGARRDPLTVCDNCKSWKLVPLGIGTDRIAEEVHNLLPDVPLFVLDKDEAPTRSRALEIIEAFAKTKGGILIGTELTLLYLEKLPYTAVVSLDSLFSIPDFTAPERVFYLLSHLHSMTETEFLVQTRSPNEETIEFASQGNILDFYRGQLEERKELQYPPLTLFIKVSLEDTSERCRKAAAFLMNRFNTWSPDFILARGRAMGSQTLSMIIRVPRASWPNEKMIEQLFLLSPAFSIKVDPKSLL